MHKPHTVSRLPHLRTYVPSFLYESNEFLTRLVHKTKVPIKGQVCGLVDGSQDTSIVFYMPCPAYIGPVCVWEHHGEILLLRWIFSAFSPPLSVLPFACVLAIVILYVLPIAFDGLLFHYAPGIHTLLLKWKSVGVLYFYFAIILFHIVHSETI